MKNTLSVILVVFTFLSCTKEDSYKISGTIDDLDQGTVLLMVQDVNHDYITIDSAEVVEGSFFMEGKIESPEMVRVQIKGTRKLASFFIENSEISFETKIDTFYNATIKGSSLHEKLVAYYDQMGEKFTKRSREINDKYKKARRENDEEKMAEYSEKLDEISEEQSEYQLDYVKNNASSYIAPYVAQRLQYGKNSDELKELISLLDENVLNSIYVKQLNSRIEILEKTAIGKQAIDFTQDDPDGNPITLSSLYGNYLLVDFWASWCGPCREENPNLTAAYKKYHDRGFEILGVSLDRPGRKDDWIKAIEEDNLTWKHVSDLNFWNNAAVKLYGISSVPSNFLVDKHGIIIAKDLRGEDLLKKLEELFGV